VRDPSERDYVIRPGSGPDEGREQCWVCGQETPPFAGDLVLAPDENEALRYRVLHLRLRRTWRNDSRDRELAAMLTQQEVRRSRLQNVFSQLRPQVPLAKGLCCPNIR